MSNQQIIALAGRKEAGKTTAVNFMIGLHMTALGIIKGEFMLNEKGELYITDIDGNSEYEGIFDINRGTPEMDLWLANRLDPYLKVYNFADLLKTEVAMKILGLSFSQCYGTDEDKNTLTNLLWENMPNIYDYVLGGPTKEGKMSAREVLQYVGSNIFRKMYNNVWVDATIRRIKDEGAITAIITDCRFPNEVEGIQNEGGKVIRLTRNPHPEDNHISEIALDEDRFDWKKFNYVLDNKDMTIIQQNDEIYKILKKWELLPGELDGVHI